jgi:hypothetical protein
MSEPLKNYIDEQALGNPLQRKGDWFRTLKSVAWSFVGLRNGQEIEADAQKINPIHLVVVGVGIAAAFVVGLIFFVRWAVIVAK